MDWRMSSGVLWGTCGGVGISASVPWGTCGDVGISASVPWGTCRDVGISASVPWGICRDVGISASVPWGTCRDVGMSASVPWGTCRDVGMSASVPWGTCRDSERFGRVSGRFFGYLIRQSDMMRPRTSCIFRSLSRVVASRWVIVRFSTGLSGIPLSRISSLHDSTST